MSIDITMNIAKSGIIMYNHRSITSIFCNVAVFLINADYYLKYKFIK